MRTFLSTAFLLLFAPGIWSPSGAQIPAPSDPAVEQIAFIRYYDCYEGAWSTGNDYPPPCSESVLMNADGTHVFPMLPIGAWSPDGTRLLVAGGVAPNDTDIFVTSVTGVMSVNLTNHPAYDLWPAWSPDGTRIAFASDRDGRFDLYVMNADGSDGVRIATSVGMAWRPMWSPDSSRLAFNCIVDPASAPWWSATDNFDICAINADGSGFARLTTAPGTDDDPVWSPDSTRLAFTCVLDSIDNVDICAINADGSGFVRLTSEPGSDFDPDWSPNGSGILFVTTRYGGTEIVVMNPAGGDGVTRVTPWIVADTPSWSSDGTRIAFVYRIPWDPEVPWNRAMSFVYVMNADGTGATDLGWGDSPVWRPRAAGVNEQPVASFTFECGGLTCTFDGLPSSDGDGPIVSYLWQFGDGTTGSGVTVIHTFAARKTYDFRLIVADDRGALGSSEQRVDLNQRPVVSFISTCIGFTCAFDGRGSSDDETIVYYAWLFGDGTWSQGATASHTYAAAGTYSVTLRAIDNLFAEGTQSQAVTLVSANIPPVAAFTSSCSGLTCTFDASATSDSDGTIAGYAWNFGDATTGSGATASRTYARGGTYAVLLTVADDRAAMSTHTQDVTVAPRRVGPRIAYDQCWADAGNMESVCDIHILVDGVETRVVSREVGARWSPDGSRIAFTGSYSNFAEIVVMNLADGSVANLTNHPAHDFAPAWSPNGRIAFVSDRDASIELYVMNADGSNPTRLTDGVGFNGAFAWSPDGGRIAWVSDRDGAPELYVMAADGSNPTRLTFNAGFKGQLAWSSDSGRIAFACEVESGNWDICAVNSDGTDFVRLTADPATDSGAVFSPVDGRIAFETSRFGANTTEIAIMHADGGVSRVAAGTGGVQPAWSPDGSQLVFVGTTPSGYSGICYFDEGAHNADDYCMPMFDMYLINADGTGLRAIATGYTPRWFTPLPGRPEAAFTSRCLATTCDFDAFGSVDYDGTITSYAWQFGDGTSASGATASHAYTRGDRYTATLTVTDDGGATAVVSMSVYANTPPVASYTVECIGYVCSFDGSGSSDGDGAITSYYWLFGDGESSGSPTSYPKTAYAYASGTFSATLIVSDNGGSTSSQTQSLSIVNAVPVVSFTRTCLGLTCTFDGRGTFDPDGTIDRVLWRFGDGDSRYGEMVVTHAYAAAGTYTASLEVLDNTLQSVTQAETVTVGNAPPVASFTRTCSGLTCTFSGLASSDPDGTIVSYAWSFGDAATGSGATTSRTYAASGTYAVTLIVTDNGGATNTQTQSVTVAVPLDIHVGDLDPASTIQPTRWTATVTVAVHDSSHGPVANAAVSGCWNNGSTASCTTNASGQCAVSRSGIFKTKTSVSFTVTNVARATLVYTPAANHDPDGDSNGISVTVSKP